MTTLTIRGVPEELHEQLRDRAAGNRRSLNSEVLVILERALLGSPREGERPGDSLPPPPPAGDIKRILNDHRQDLRALGVRRIGLFGSVLRGTAGADSDADVLVEFDPAQKTYDRFAALASLLERLLGRPVDLVTTEGLSPFIGPRNLEEAEFVAVGA
ncbi:MAG: nucleotidyltransferase domain-containing protein [Gemmatimonadota bacterium]